MCRHFTSTIANTDLYPERPLGCDWHPSIRALQFNFEGFAHRVCTKLRRGRCASTTRTIHVPAVSAANFRIKSCQLGRLRANLYVFGGSFLRRIDSGSFEIRNWAMCKNPWMTRCLPASYRESPKGPVLPSPRHQHTVASRTVRVYSCSYVVAESSSSKRTTTSYG